MAKMVIIVVGGKSSGSRNRHSRLSAVNQAGLPSRGATTSRRAGKATGRARAAAASPSAGSVVRGVVWGVPSSFQTRLCQAPASLEKSVRETGSGAAAKLARERRTPMMIRNDFIRIVIVVGGF